MARNQSKIGLTKALASGDNTTELFDLTNFSSIAYAIKGPGAGAGTLKIQGSMNKTDWADIASATTSITSGFAQVQATFVAYPFVRAHINLSAGAGNYDIYELAKDF